MIVSVLAMLVTLFLLVGVHEAGHAWVAKWFKVKILRISIGFGRPLFLWKSKGGLEWVWALWPLGGYVQLLDSRMNAVKEEDLSYCFDRQAIYKRVLILIAGGIANFILAWFAFLLFFMQGHVALRPQVPAVIAGSIADKAGLMKNDRIIAVADEATPSLLDLTRELLLQFGKKAVEVRVLNSQGEIRKLHFDLIVAASPDKKTLFDLIGIQWPAKAQNREKVPGLPFTEALPRAFQALSQTLYFFLMMIKQVLTRAVPFSLLLGPLSIVAVSIDSFTAGLAVFMYFIANFSLSIGLVNLLPFPGLDGGSVLYALVEKIRGRPLSLPLEVLLYRLTLIAFLLFLMELFMNDLRRL